VVKEASPSGINNCVIDETCCDYLKIIFKFDYETIINIKHITIDHLSTPFIGINSILINAAFTKGDVHFFTNLPPPGGFDLLKIIQVFRL
jgi:hypothetical protein